MCAIHISKEEAKRFLVNYHGLLKRYEQGYKAGIENYIKKVGCVQFDPLNVVGRNPDLVLQSRILDYKPKMLEQLLYDDRALIDGWDKMMAIYQTNDWPYFKRVRAQYTLSNLRGMTYKGTLNALNYQEQVKTILKQEGAKLSREIDVGGIERSSWGSGRYANVVLDHLFHKGEVGVSKKKNNQKVFDVIENLIPEDLLEMPDPFSSEHDLLKWYVKRRIGSVGMLWSKNGGGWLGHFISNKRQREIAIEELVENQSIMPVSIEGIRETFYILAENLKDIQQVPDIENKEIRFLAPLDNLLWDRALVDKIFDFKYSWEVYVPANKRKYGYYVLPVLYGENLIARFEPLKHTSGSSLQIKDWWWETGIKVTETLTEAIENEFDAFSKYLGGDGIYGTDKTKIW